VGHNGEAAPHVCVPANAVSDLIFLLYAIAKINRHIALLSKSQKLNIPKQNKEYQTRAIFVLTPAALN